MVQQCLAVTLGQSLTEQQSWPSTDTAAQRGSQVTRQCALEAALLSSPHLWFLSTAHVKAMSLEITRDKH